MRSTSALLTLDKHALGAREKDKMLSKMAKKSGATLDDRALTRALKKAAIKVPAAAMALGKGWGRM